MSFDIKFCFLVWIADEKTLFPMEPLIEELLFSEEDLLLFLVVFLVWFCDIWPRMKESFAEAPSMVTKFCTWR